MSYNIRYGGLGREQQLAAVIREVAPDIVIFQEATRPQVIEQVAAATGMKHWGARNGHSLGFVSRLELAHHEWHRPPGTRHAFLELAPVGTEFRVFGVHLSAIHSNWTERRRVRELRATLQGIAQHQEGFHVLVGDFNTLAPGEILETRRLPHRLRPLVWLSGGTIRWQTVQLMLEARYLDGYRLLHLDDKGYTFPTWDPHLRLDYLFIPAAFVDRLKSLRVGKDHLQAAQASDHFPLVAELEVAAPQA